MPDERPSPPARLARYLALGDSMSIDLYPALDAGDGTAPAPGRSGMAGDVAPLGAASLLHANDDRRWPAFAGRDLRTLHPGARLTSLAADGATIGDVFSEQLPLLEPGDDAALVTLTLGGNDLLESFIGAKSAARFAAAVRDIGDAYAFLVGEIAARVPRATLVLTTVYDPTDATGEAPGLFEDRGPLPVDQIDALNERIRQVAAATPGARVADAQARFLGHGVMAPTEERWYWRKSIIEPSLIGASELRRLWLEVLGV